MRPLVVLVLAPILALGLVVSAGVFVPDEPSISQPKPQSIVWANRVFTSRAQFARWLARHDRSYEEWVKLHPSATWFHKTAPVLATRPPKPASVKAAEVDREFARILVAAASGLLALLLAGAVVRSRRGALPSFRRARPGLVPLGAAPAYALEDAPQTTIAAPARAATMALPNGMYPAASPRRAGGKVVPIYVPPQPDAEPAVARPAASHEASVLDFRPALVAEPAPTADPEPAYETPIEPELLVVAEPAVVSWPDVTSEPEPVPDPEPVSEREEEQEEDEEKAPGQPEALPLLHPPPAVHPPPVVHRKPVVHAEPPRPTKPAASPAPAREEPAPTREEDEKPPAVRAPAASARSAEEPAEPAEQRIDEPAFENEADENVAADAGPLTCQIGIWQGYLKSQFYARAVGPDGEEYAVAQSGRFRCKNPLVRDEAAAAALDQLTRELIEFGWKPDGRDGDWWALRFQLDGEIDR